MLDPSLLGTTGRLERLWAQKRIANLLLDSRTNEGEIVRFAKAHGIVTPFTSLLVLETLQDYVRYRVSPPEELAEAWAKAIQVADAQTVKTRDEKLVSLGWRRPLDAAAIEAKRKQEQELSERIAREHAARRDSSTEELAIERKKALIQKLIRDGVELLDQEKYDQAEVTFGDILERDPGNDQAIKFREIAREGRHLKAASTNHKDRVSDEYLEDLNEITVASPEVPDGRTVTFPDKDFWVNKVLRREAGTDGAAPLVVSANRQRSAPVATDAATEAKRMRDQELADRVAREERALGDASTQEQQAIERRKAQIQRFIRDGVELLDQEKYEEAEAMFADILERDPENGQAMELREIAREGRHLRTSSANQKDGEGVLRALSSSATDDQLYAAYLDEKAFHGSEPAFYLDSADVFFARNLRTLGLRVLTNLAGLEVESAPLMRLLAYRLKEAGELDLAIAAFEEVARLRPEEPQSFRDLALAQADAGDLASAVANLEKVVLGTWDGRFPGIEHIALGELGQLVARAGAKPLPTLTLPRELVTHAELDLRVVLTWDADATDVDLWVTEPSGEKAMYNHKNTASGGIFGNDFTRGYGPEEYRLAKAPSGRFKVQVNSFGDSRQTERTPISVHVSVFRNYGRPDETRQDFTRRLGHESEVLDVAEIEVR